MFCVVRERGKGDATAVKEYFENDDRRERKHAGKILSRHMEREARQDVGDRSGQARYIGLGGFSASSRLVEKVSGGVCVWVRVFHDVQARWPMAAIQWDSSFVCLGPDLTETTNQAAAKWLGLFGSEVCM